jgi:hypothetical protein
MGLLRAARHGRRVHGKGYPAQLAEILALRLLLGRLSPSEYYDFGLCESTRLRFGDKRRYLGWRSPVFGRLNPLMWHALANDKLVFYTLMQGLGMPTPRLYAVYHRGGRHVGPAPTLRTPDALADYLRRDMPYPCFGKPAKGVYGRGAVWIEGYEASRDCLVLRDGTERPVADFVADVPDPDGLGYLFQAVLRPASSVRALCGDRLACVRFVVLLGSSGPRPVLAEFKLPTGRNMIDNFGGGATGNLIAVIELASGCLLNAIGPDYRPIAHHPDTGKLIAGFTLDGWEAIRSLVMRAAAALPGLRFQGWDIALAGEGPVAIEVNLVTPAAAHDYQRLLGRGLLDDEILTIVRPFGPAGSRLRK